MQIAGLVKSSFVDYPQHLACVVFTLGCNMDCWYCHNQHFASRKALDEEEIFTFLKERQGILEGVVISGGEPTLQPDLEEFIAQVKDMGYKIKLDTNGTDYETVKRLIDKKLVDFIAMDIKAPLSKYKKITGTDDNMNSIEETIKILLSGIVDYEFRTTFSPDLTVSDIEEISKTLTGARTFAIQKYNLAPNKITMIERPVADHEIAAGLAKKHLNNVIIRGL